LLYVGYVMLVAKLKPSLAPPLSEEGRRVTLPAYTDHIPGTQALPGLVRALKGSRAINVPSRTLVSQLLIVLVPAAAFVLVMGLAYTMTTRPAPPPTEMVEMGIGFEAGSAADQGGLAEPPIEGGLEEPPMDGGLQEPPVEGALAQAPAAATPAPAMASSTANKEAVPVATQVPRAFWISLVVGLAAMAVFYAWFSFARLEIFKMLLGSLFPLAFMILAVLGSIVFGLATPTEAAAMGSFGGILLAIAYRRFNFGMLKESAHLTAKTSAMVCWLFVGSSIFSAAFALLGGQQIIETWVLSMNLTPVQFMLLAQVIIFLLGWPLEWTEIIVIFMPIFVPLLAHFNIDPLFFGLLVAMNLQTAFLSPPVAMSAFYLKGVSPPGVTLNQIFLGMMPFMAIQVVGIILLYAFPAIGLWLPGVLYK
ncbi:TRAP transporter large permease subunit, partial [Massilia cavernae]